MIESQSVPDLSLSSPVCLRTTRQQSTAEKIHHEAKCPAISDTRTFTCFVGKASRASEKTSRLHHAKNSTL